MQTSCFVVCRPNILRSSRLVMPKKNIAKLASTQSLDAVDFDAVMSDASLSLDDKIKAARSAHMHGIYLLQDDDPECARFIGVHHSYSGSQCTTCCFDGFADSVQVKPLPFNRLQTFPAEGHRNSEVISLC